MNNASSDAKLTCEIEVSSQDEAVKLLGGNGEFRRHIQAELPVRIVDRGTKILIIGEHADAVMAQELLNELLSAVRLGHVPTLGNLAYALTEVQSRHGHANDAIQGDLHLGSLWSEVPNVIRNDIRIKPRTHGQKRYLESIRSHELTFAIGPAGTGKTFLAMAAAISALLNKEVNRVILTRPAVEAGESLGFLPGDLQEKVSPYLRPLFDALYSMVDVDTVNQFIEQERIEVAPLAFMRGRTLDHCYAILDEAQNTTTEQMLMFLTRLGEGTRAIVTGDVTQTDLPKGIKSGLIEAKKILHSVKGISFVALTGRDVVRHPLVQRIVTAYESDKNSSTRRSKEGTD